VANLTDDQIRLIKDKAGECAAQLGAEVLACSNYIVLKDASVVRVRVSVTPAEDIVRQIHQCLHEDD